MLAALKSHRREFVDPAITAEHKGRIVKTTGDGELLLEFASAVDAATCAMAVQSKMMERNGAGQNDVLRSAARHHNQHRREDRGRR